MEKNAILEQKSLSYRLGELTGYVLLFAFCAPVIYGAIKLIMLF